VGEAQNVYRAKFSSITQKDIVQSYETLRDGPNQNQSISVDARQIIDLKVGVAFSRFQSLHLKKRFLNLNQRMITFGPCQTPTLNFCVDRHFAIKNFRSEAFWRIVPKIFTNTGDQIQLYWTQDRTSNQQEAELIKREIESEQQVQVFDISGKESTKWKPEGLNTVQMLKQASTLLGISPNDAMHVAEKLYLGGYTTYPRTESTSYSKNFDFNGILTSFATHKSPYQEYAGHIMQNFNRPRDGYDAGDHPPITPTVKVPRIDA